MATALLEQDGGGRAVACFARRVGCYYQSTQHRTALETLTQGAEYCSYAEDHGRGGDNLVGLLSYGSEADRSSTIQSFCPGWTV